ncbi:MAG: histidine kinase [Nitrospiraceae bacterium]|nr:histidine kinase [Nitrospiraceae bacterium]
MSQPTILVAITDIFFYTKVRDALRPHGYQLERARTHEEVRPKTAAISPAAIVMNMNDPGVDAFKALESLQPDIHARRIPILAFANHEEVETWKRAKELGVTKVVSRNEFSSRTRELVEELLSPNVKGQA